MGLALVNRQDIVEPHTEEIAKRDSIILMKEDSLKSSKLIIDSLKERIHDIGTDNRRLVRDLRSSEQQLKKIKGSLKELSNDQLVVEANKEYGGTDTTELTILLSRPTTEFLVESAKEIKILTNQYEFLKKLYSNTNEMYIAQVAISNQHERDKEILTEIIDVRTEQLEISEEAYGRAIKREKKNKRNQKLVIIGAAALLGYGIIK